MSDHNRPRENRLKREFEETLANGLIDTNHPHDEPPGDSRLEFMTPTPADDMRKRSRLMFTRAPKVTGEGTSLVCLQCTNNVNGSFPLSSGISECDAGSSQLCFEGFRILCGSKCMSGDHSIDGLKY